MQRKITSISVFKCAWCDQNNRQAEFMVVNKNIHFCCDCIEKAYSALNIHRKKRADEKGKKH